MHTFIILRTKPRLSQAGALLLPKDSVSLGKPKLRKECNLLEMSVG